MDTIFGDQLVPHALQDPGAVKVAMSKMEEVAEEATEHKESQN